MNKTLSTRVLSAVVAVLVVAAGAVTVTLWLADEPTVVHVAAPLSDPGPVPTSTTAPTSTTTVEVAVSTTRPAPSPTTATPPQTSQPPPVTTVRTAAVVGAEMAAAAAYAGAVDEGAFLRRLPAKDSCRACAGAAQFRSWCADAGGHLVGTTSADAHVFADDGPVYCYPGAHPLSAPGGSA